MAPRGVQLRCNVVQDPFSPCSRCQRCHLECKIDLNFRRVGKRKRNAEMEQEIDELRRRLRRYEQRDQQHPAMMQQQQPVQHPITPQRQPVTPLPRQSMTPLQRHASMVNGSTPTTTTAGMTMAQHGLGMMPVTAGGPPGPGPGYGLALPPMASNLDQYMGSHEAVTSLMDLKSGVDGYMRSPGGRPHRRIEDLVLTNEQVESLFNMSVSPLFFLPALALSSLPSFTHTHLFSLYDSLLDKKNHFLYFTRCLSIYLHCLSISLHLLLLTHSLFDESKLS